MVIVNYKADICFTKGLTLTLAFIGSVCSDWSAVVVLLLEMVYLVSSRDIIISGAIIFAVVYCLNESCWSHRHSEEGSLDGDHFDPLQRPLLSRCELYICFSSPPPY